MKGTEGIKGNFPPPKPDLPSMLLPSGQLLLVPPALLYTEAFQNHQTLWLCLTLLQQSFPHTNTPLLKGIRPLLYQTLYPSFISKEPISIFPGSVQLASPLRSLP